MITVNVNPKELGSLVIAKPHTFEYGLTSAINPAIITHIKAGCGSCTLASMNASTIAPNSTEVIKITFTPNSLGLQTKRVTVTYTVLGISQELNLEFTATVIN